MNFKTCQYHIILIFYCQEASCLYLKVLFCNIKFPWECLIVGRNRSFLFDKRVAGNWRWPRCRRVSLRNSYRTTEASRSTSRWKRKVRITEDHLSSTEGWPCSATVSHCSLQFWNWFRKSSVLSVFDHFSMNGKQKCIKKYVFKWSHVNVDRTLMLLCFFVSEWGKFWRTEGWLMRRE